MSISLKSLDYICLVFILVIMVSGSAIAIIKGESYQRIAEQRGEMLKKQQNELALADNNVKKLQESIASAHLEMKRLNEQIPENAEIGTFLTQVDTLIRQSGVTLVSLEPLPATDEKMYSKIPVNLKFRGAFSDSYRVLSELEMMGRLLQIENLSISKAETENQCVVDITANIFEQ
ncbi:MAG: type 4a pilus biogenesis protein PilO [Pseudomonadota bacterium]